MILKGKDNMKGPMNKSILTMKNSSSSVKKEKMSLSSVCHNLRLENKEVFVNCKYYDKTTKLLNLQWSVLIWPQEYLVSIATKQYLQKQDKQASYNKPSKTKY